MNIYILAFLLLFQFSFAFDRASEFPGPSSCHSFQQKLQTGKTEAANLVFKSTDDGQTWQDISEGLPVNLKEDDLRQEGVFAGNNGIYLRAGNGIYHSKTNSKAPFWEKEFFPEQEGGIFPGKTGIFACNYGGQFLQKINGTSIWSPVYTNFHGDNVNTVFETTGGTVFIGSDKGLFKTTNSGQTWKQVNAGAWVMKMVESNGVLMATSSKGILRSTDDGENWSCVLYEGGAAITVEQINGGFATINYNTKSKTRRVRTSYDDGKTWQAIDAGLPASLDIASIIQVGDYFFCGHPTGIFRSSDKGKTWNLLRPSINGKVFNLSVSGSVIYAIPWNGGC